MPRNMPPGLATLLARKDKQIKSHTTLEVFVNTTTFVKSYHFATARLEFDGIVWLPQLRKGPPQIRSSLTRAADSGTVELQNVDTEIGREFLSLGESLYNAQAKIGRYWFDLESRVDPYHKVFLTGVLQGLSGDENLARLTAVADPYAEISVGASRRVTTLCQWDFRNPLTCTYNGSLRTCNFHLNNANGCDGRHGANKEEKFGGFAYLSSKSRLRAF